MNKKYDILVIGAGPGGYPCAIRAGQLGKKVLVVDKGFLGGECLNWGCIPSKALISAANFYKELSHAETMGIKVEKAQIDVQKLQSWKKSVSERLIGGIAQLLKANKAEYLEGTCSFVNDHTVEVIRKDNGEKELIEADNIVIAIGTEFISLPGFQIDEKNIVSAKGALSLSKIPEHFLIIGGGIIGMELGMVYAKLGSKLTVVELMPEILPGIDPTLVRLLHTNLRKLGVTVHRDSRATSIHYNSNGTMDVEIQTKTEKLIITVDKILLSVGKRANVSSLKIENSNVKTDQRGFILIDKQCRTNVSHIFAVGDCTGMPFLAHRATKHGIIAAEVIAGHEASEIDFVSIPGAIFTDPEIAFAGLSEQQAKEEGYEVITGRASFGASGRAITHLKELGYIKVIADAHTNVLLGVEIVGINASDLISEAALALEMGATLEDVAHTIHPHPTLPEMLMEACEQALGKAIHVMNPK
ncbi:MAG: dihydrolipoyl dehydrogenase [Candidatus Thorarchaeota archaeon]